MNRILAFKAMIAISGLSFAPFHFAQGQSDLPDQVVPGQEVNPEGRGKGEPTAAPEDGKAAKGRGKNEAGKSGKSRDDETDPAPPEAQNPPVPAPPANTIPMTPQVQAPPETEAPIVTQSDPTKGRGKSELGKAGKARDNETDPALPEAQNPPVPLPPVAIPMTPPATETPSVPQTAPNPEIGEKGQPQPQTQPETPPQTARNPRTGEKGAIRDNPLQPKGPPANRPPNISKGGPKGSPGRTAPEPVPTLPPADPEVEKEIARATERVEKEVNQKKTAIKTEAEALDIIRKVIGGDSEISQSEIQRDRRIESERLRDNRPEKKDPARDESVSYLLKRFQGKASLSDAPPSLRHDPRPPPTRPDQRRLPDRDQRPGPASLDRQHPVFNGYRHVRFKSKAEIPAILLAVSALNRIEIRNYNELTYLPPTGFEMVPEYRDQSAPVVSYQVDPNSMVSRDDILFLQGSTSFADRNSFETVRDLAIAMSDPSLARQRFVVEGHASAEGGYDFNLALSQRRAERIVRDIVRFGVSPDRLVPVGYGKSEAAYAASDPDQYRRLDRKVVIFRLSR